MFRVIRAYYGYLSKKAWDSGKYGSLNEMRWQALPWMLTTAALAVIGGLPLGLPPPISNLIIGLAFTIWFIGLGIVGVAFTRVAFARKRRGGIEENKDD